MDGLGDDASGDEGETVTIAVLGDERRVPAGMTLLNALRASGEEWLHGCGCRVGDCGECETTFRLPGDPTLHRAFACVIAVQPGMRVLDLPFGWAKAYRRAQGAR